MPSALPAGVLAGQIYRHSRFYQDATGQWQTKYLLVLAPTSGSDVIFRLLTSRAHGRPEQPPCYHGDPYPGYYLGHLGGKLTAKSWLDLRKQDDYDGRIFAADVAAGALTLALTLSQAILCLALDCAANAEDTLKLQERGMRDQRAALGCN